MKSCARAVACFALVVFIATAPGQLSAQTASMQGAGRDAYPHASEPIGTVRQIYDSVLTPE
ncbi:MAG: hypothetical protein OEW79_01170, partial [Betaproteobacteria bacterium]|nr:hypothetical protein [Betaproteobacteria bacterium]